MRKGFIYGTALALAMAGGGVATAKSTQASPDGEIKGTYNCQLTGGFIAQAASTGLGQFSVDGKGNVTDAAGQLAVTIGGENQPSTASSNGFFFISQYTFQACDYTPSGGLYSLSANGSGTLSIQWTPSASNADSPVDCTEDITTDYDILVNSAASFTLNSTDLLPSTCGDPNIDYADCGSSFTGTCVQQAAKP
jgi:hypothetical protein